MHTNQVKKERIFLQNPLNYEYVMFFAIGMKVRDNIIKEIKT